MGDGPVERDDGPATVRVDWSGPLTRGGFIFPFSSGARIFDGERFAGWGAGYTAFSKWTDSPSREAAEVAITNRRPRDHRHDRIIVTALDAIDHRYRARDS